MTNHLNADRIAKMQQARIDKKQNSKGLIWSLVDGIEIHVDKFQYILVVPGELDHFYHFDLLGDIIKDLFYKRAINSMLKDERKNVESVSESFAEAKRWLDEVLTPALSPFTSKSIRKSID